MKGITALAVMSGVLLGMYIWAAVNNTPTEVEKEEVLIEVQPDWATDQEAVEAAQAVIRKKELEAELNALEANFEAVKATYEAEQEAYQTRREQLQKDLGTF